MTQSEKAKRMNELVGDEMIAHLQYTFAASKVIGPDNDACKAEFTEHAQEEYDHMLKLLDKMNEQHMPINADILALTKNAYSGYQVMDGVSSHDLLLFHHNAEVNAIKAYKSFLRELNDDPGLHKVIEDILNDELKHRVDLEKLESSVDDRTSNLMPSQELFSKRFAARDESKTSLRDRFFASVEELRRRSRMRISAYNGSPRRLARNHVWADVGALKG